MAPSLEQHPVAATVAQHAFPQAHRADEFRTGVGPRRRVGSVPGRGLVWLTSQTAPALQVWRVAPDTSPALVAEIASLVTGEGDASALRCRILDAVLADIDGHDILIVSVDANGVSQLVLVDLHRVVIAARIQLRSPATRLAWLGQPGHSLLPELAHALSAFQGVLAVGSLAGRVYLLDVFLPATDVLAWHPDDPAVVRGIQLIDPDDPDDLDAAELRTQRRGTVHAAIPLNTELYTRHGTLQYLPGAAFAADQCAVSALRYFPAMRCLAVGYTFGAWSLWSVVSLKREYASVPSEDASSIADLVYMQLPDDQGHGFIWIISGADDATQRTPTQTQLVSVRYARPADFTAWVTARDGAASGDEDDAAEVPPTRQRDLPRLVKDVDAMLERPLVLGDSKVSRFLVAAPFPEHVDSLADEPLDANDATAVANAGATRMLLAWEAVTEDGSSRAVVEVFDLQRYMSLGHPAHVPAHLPWFKSFLHPFTLPPSFPAYTLRAVLVDPATVVDTHVKESDGGDDSDVDDNDDGTSPASVPSFTCLAVTSDAVWTVDLFGPTDLNLLKFAVDAPDSLANPSDCHAACVAARLLAPSSSTSADELPLVAAGMREQLFALALERGVPAAVAHFVSEAAPVRSLTDQLLRDATADVTGNDLVPYMVSNPQPILDWAWAWFLRRRGDMWRDLDALCATQSSASSAQLSALVHRLERVFSHITGVYYILAALIARDTVGSEQSVLATRLNEVMLACQTVELGIWLAQHGVTGACYPAMSLCASARERRAARAARHATAGHVDVTNMVPLPRPADDSQARGLLIDAVMSSLSPLPIEGDYPPRSLRALLDMFASSAPAAILRKRCVTAYLLLDMSHDAQWSRGRSGEDRAALVGTFSRQFMLPPAVNQVLLAFWLLDIGNATRALPHLCDPDVDVDLPERVLELLFDMQAMREALAFLRATQPALPTLADATVAVRVLLGNDLLHEAVVMARAHGGADPAALSALLYHVFAYAVQAGRADELFQLPWAGVEEAALEQYLLVAGDASPAALDLLVMYYLQRCRFVEARQLHQRISNAAAHASSGDPADAQAGQVRSAVLDNVMLTQPAALRSLAERPPLHTVLVGSQGGFAARLDAAAGPSASASAAAVPAVVPKVVDVFAAGRAPEPRSRARVHSPGASSGATDAPSTPFLASKQRQFLAAAARGDVPTTSDFVAPPSISKQAASPSATPIRVWTQPTPTPLAAASASRLDVDASAATPLSPPSPPVFSAADKRIGAAGAAPTPTSVAGAVSPVALPSAPLTAQWVRPSLSIGSVASSSVAQSASLRTPPRGRALFSRLAEAREARVADLIRSVSTADPGSTAQAAAPSPSTRVLTPTIARRRGRVRPIDTTVGVASSGAGETSPVTRSMTRAAKAAAAARTASASSRAASPSPASAASNAASRVASPRPAKVQRTPRQTTASGSGSAKPRRTAPAGTTPRRITRSASKRPIS